MSYVRKKMVNWRKKMFKDAPKTEKEIVELAHEMFDYIHNKSDCHSLENFSIHAKISIPEIKHLAQENNYFAKVLSLTKSVISDRIQCGWRDKKLDREYARKFLEIYNEEFKEVMRERMQARIQAEYDTQPIQVIRIPDFQEESNLEAQA